MCVVSENGNCYSIHAYIILTCMHHEYQKKRKLSSTCMYYAWICYIDVYIKQSVAENQKKKNDKDNFVHI